jgi:uracil phosphoribosyltransferase
MTFILNQHHSIANHMLRELRDRAMQRDPMRFRHNVERLGSILAYEISKSLSYHEEVVETPLGQTSVFVINQQPLLITVLRAGLPFFHGFQYVFDQADSGFIGAWREEGSGDIRINLNYVATPSVEGREVIIIDPMLATGKSFLKSLMALEKHGKPSFIHVAALVAAPEGIRHIEDNIKHPFKIWTCALDEGLNEHAYIVPGLGDAGDLCYGEKL